MMTRRMEAITRSSSPHRSAARAWWPGLGAVALGAALLGGAPGCGSSEDGAALLADVIGQAAPADAAPEVRSAWQRFLIDHPGRVATSWALETATPQAIYGELSRPVRGEAATVARRFLRDHARLFGLADATLGDLGLAHEMVSPLGRHLVFEQRYRGLPVRGGSVRVHVTADGRVVALTSGYIPRLSLPTTVPALPREVAIARARASTLPTGEPLNDLADVAAPSAELVVALGEGGRAVLAWQTTLPTAGPTWEVLIDAGTGRLLGAPVDTNRYANGTGQIFQDNAIVATQNNALRDNNDSAAAVPSSAYRTVTLQGLAGTGLLDGTYASSKNSRRRVSSASNSFIYDRSTDGFNEVMGYYFIDYAERYIQTLGFTNINNRQVAFSIDRYKQDNSYYSPSTQAITYGTGGVDDAEDAEVILHELGHAIQDNQVPNFGTSAEGGAMGEGFGDYWGGTVGAQFSAGFQDACVAEWDATSYSSANPPCLRRLDGTKHYPENVVGEVHADGEIWSAALWQIRGALGATRSDRVVLQAHFLLSASATFNQGANALVTAAINLGYSATEVDAMRTILRNRGFTVTV